MASGWTNRGLFNAMGVYLKNATEPTTFYAVLVTDTVSLLTTATRQDINTFADLANEIPAGNGYTSGGLALPRDATGFPTTSEDDTNNRSDFTVKDLVWTATGGSLPGSGTGARYCVITDDNATLNSREVIAVIDLGGNKIATVGQSLTASGFICRASNS